MRALVDTGATINLIRSDIYSKIVAAPRLRTYNDSLETADGPTVSVDGWVTTKLELGSINDGMEALVVPELNAGMILGMRSLRAYECALDFHGDSLWTEPKEGSIVPLHDEPLRTSTAPDHPKPSAGAAGLLTKPAVSEDAEDPKQPAYGPGDVVKGWTDEEEDHVVQAVSDMGEIVLQAQAGRHLEKDVESWLPPA